MYEHVDEQLVQQDLVPDPRVKNWLLVNPVSFVLSLCAYMAVIKIILPKYMEKRKPYNLKNTLILYNAIQVLISLYLVYLGVESWFVYQKASFWKCSGIVKDNSAYGMKPLLALYVYFMSKFTEFFDTFFFILRKKFDQASFLHIYHHVSTPAFTWFVVRYYPGGSFVFFMILNSFVHVIMYSYYMLAALGPHMRKYLWWKKYITSMQLIQFYTCMVHIVFMLFSECNISRLVMLAFLTNGFVLHFLFSSFYKRTYTAASTPKDKSVFNGTDKQVPSTSKTNDVHKISEKNGFLKHLIRPK